MLVSERVIAYSIRKKNTHWNDEVVAGNFLGGVMAWCPLNWDWSEQSRTSGKLVKIMSHFVIILFELIKCVPKINNVAKNGTICCWEGFPHWLLGNILCRTLHDTKWRYSYLHGAIMAHHRSPGRGGRGFHLGLEIAVWMGRMEGTMLACLCNKSLGEVR